MNELRDKILNSCIREVELRIETARVALHQAQEASTDDTKSSAGDKFETTREMMQQDIERSKKLLSVAEENMRQLLKLEHTKPGDQVRNGSLLRTDQGNFFICISLGQIQIDSEIFFVLSSASPLGSTLLGKKAGEEVLFNGKRYALKEVF